MISVTDTQPNVQKTLLPYSFYDRNLNTATQATYYIIGNREDFLEGDYDDDNDDDLLKAEFAREAESRNPGIFSRHVGTTTP